MNSLGSMYETGIVPLECAIPKISSAPEKKQVCVLVLPKTGIIKRVHEN